MSSWALLYRRELSSPVAKEQPHDYENQLMRGLATLTSFSPLDWVAGSIILWRSILSQERVKRLVQQVSGRGSKRTQVSWHHSFSSYAPNAQCVCARDSKAVVQVLQDSWGLLPHSRLRKQTSIWKSVLKIVWVICSLDCTVIPLCVVT